MGDGEGAPRSQTIQNGAGTLTYNTDNALRPTQIGVAGAGATGPITSTLSFDNNGMVTGVGLPNGVQHTIGYDGAERLTTLGITGGAISASYGYGYDHVGWTTGVTTRLNGGAAATETLTHDALGRLLSSAGGANPGSWAYDGRNNLTSATENGVATSYSYRADNPEELASTGVSGQPAVTYGYDAQGDTTSIANGGSINTQLGYDAQNRPVTVTLASGTRITTAYNALGQRSSYTVTPSGATQPSLAEQFSYRDADPGPAQVSYSGTGLASPYTDTYVYRQDGAPLELLRQVGATTTLYYYVLDGKGNVVALTDGAGNAVDTYRYDQWGRPTTVAEAVPQQIRYGGYWYDNETQWYWLTARSYDPALERFLQPDPSEQEGLFSYAYALDNPADNADPGGLDSGQKGCLVTGDHHFDCDEAVGSQQWNDDVGKEHAQAVAGAQGASACSWGDILSNLGTALRCAKGLLLRLGQAFVRLVEDVARWGCKATGVCDDVTVLLSNAPWYDKVWVAANLGILFVPGLGEEAAGARIAARLGELGVRDASPALVNGLRIAAQDVARFCGRCFAAGTTVATPGGQVAIERLKVGDTVLSEDPRTGRVEPERVVAVIDDGTKPTMAVRLADGSRVRVTPTHPFYADWGPDLRGPGWLEADQLRVGDRLRTADGRGTAVAGLEYNTGSAHVYTLTVATDHTFFVAAAQVLVHNSGPCPDVVGLPAFSKSSVDEAVQQVGMPYNSRISIGARALSKRLGDRSPEFAGLPMTTEQAQSLVRNILENPVRVVFGDKTTMFTTPLARGYGSRSRTTSS